MAAIENICFSRRPVFARGFAAAGHTQIYAEIKIFCLGDPTPPEGYDGTSFAQAKASNAFQA